MPIRGVPARLLSNVEILRGYWTFCWAGDVNSKELKEDKFDLEHYQKYFKASVVRKVRSRRLVWEYQIPWPEDFTAIAPAGTIIRLTTTNLHACCDGVEARPRSGRRPAVTKAGMTGDADSDELIEWQGVCWIYWQDVARSISFWYAFIESYSPV